jgi:uncharacterized membrane protein SirB2|tara:strand:- start:17494 stop:17805 length:312 start_codon:yes stop_codon:yes gene_type:complete
MLQARGILHHPLVKVLPHVIDTILLLSALTLTVLIGQYPFINGWLTAKFFALIGYIILGTIALKRGRTRRIRALAFGCAMLLFGYIVSVALFHDPRGILLVAW